MEIKAGVFSMHPNTAPALIECPPPPFFQKYWHIIKLDVVNAINSFFHSGYMLKGVNQTLVTLIPKVAAPINLSQFRPISLCNVFSKIISKILANKLKKVLLFCINNSQPAFLPGRQILVNVM